ncbi:MAG: hypothetical protein SFY66_04585 [Oculatellaceae cyanobacterium bins.114]|nr:hypothetical protein [Oculatellaceae cyanobacterium bins.114]
MTNVLSQTASFQIQTVTTPEQQEWFLDIPAKVYANDPHWVPPIRSSIAKQLSPTNPFFQYGKLQQFIAVRPGANGEEAVGRIVASVNQRLIEREGEAIGLFGYFECINDGAIAQALLDAASQWLREQGMVKVRGPIDLSTHNNCLFLVDGFDSTPYLMMPYNAAYYPQFMEQDGWYKAKDAYAYDLPLDRPLPDEFEKGYRIALKSGITFRQLHLKGDAFKQDVLGLYHLFTKAFSNNWSSTPRTEEEFFEEAKSLQDLVDPEIFWIAEYEGEMVGFFMTLPDYNPVLKRVNGKLNWLGILKFLWYRRQIDTARVIAICALPEHRRRMVPLGLIHIGMKHGVEKRKPYRRAELSWVYEDNMPSRKVIEATGAKIYKTYRIYEKVL